MKIAIFLVYIFSKMLIHIKMKDLPPTFQADP